MSDKPLNTQWEKAKDAYDKAFKENEKARSAVQKQIDKMMSEGAKECKKQKVKGKFSEYVADEASAKYDNFRSPLLDKVRAKQKELIAIGKLDARKSVGLTPAFKDVEKVLEVGMRLGRAGVKDPAKWSNWRDAAIASLTKCAKAETKFKAWMGNAHNHAPDAKEFKEALEKIMSNMSDRGKPLMKHAGTIAQAA